MVEALVRRGWGGLAFVASWPLAEWMKSSRYHWLGTFPVQAVIGLPFALLIFAAEKKLIWKLLRQDVFSMIHPISIAAFAGYVVLLGDLPRVRLLGTVMGYIAFSRDRGSRHRVRYRLF